MKQAVAIRHVAFEDLGTFEDGLRRNGYDIRYVDATIDRLDLPAFRNADLLVILGGPIGVYEERQYPFLTKELVLIEQRLAAQAPVLGICLGCQLMARALGARVYAGGDKEIGWGPIDLTASGHVSPLRHLAAGDGAVLHWHGDTFDMPEGAEGLASTRHYPHQAFRYGTKALALQFHAEVSALGLERWFVGHAVEIAATPAVSVEQLRDDTRRWSPALAAAASRLLDEWLSTALE